MFTVERDVRGKWVCNKCHMLVQAPVAPHIIDKGLPTTGLLAQVLVAKYLDHLPLYRQEHILEPTSCYRTAGSSPPLQANPGRSPISGLGLVRFDG